ncbi:MAG TPA: ABC transporter permease [Candidatus Mediterraneibacter excrementipullorum]|nr:ABC transporter permease [Candidatus Mediterraneibacter excrementipullorum]
MSRLLCADFAKLKKNRFFWLCIIGMVGFGLFMKIMEYITMQQYADEAPPLDSMLSVYSMVIGFLTAAFVSLFVGTEYSDGTIRNKIIIGHSRAAIYFSNLITCSAAGFFMCLAYLLPALAAGIPLCGIKTADFRYLAGMILCSFIMTLAFTSLCTLAGMLCQNKAMTAVITILSVCLLFAASVYISAKLNEPETYPEISAFADDGSVIDARDVPNPGYVRGTQRQIYEFLDEFLPTGQSVILTRGDKGASFLLMSAYSAGITAVAAGMGIFIFRKRDIK